MNTPHLRAFLYNSSHQELDDLAKHITTSWFTGVGVAVIDTNAPQHIVDSSIVAIDPDEVVDITNNYETYIRELAILDEDISVVSLTSGTTSKPKAVAHTFQSMENSALAIGESLGIDETDSWLLCLSPKYIAGMAVLSRAYILHQKVSYINKFNIQSVAEKIATHNPTLISLVPAQLRILLDAEMDLSCFKAILIGGSETNTETLRECEELGYNIHRTYGMTETFGGICHDGKLFPNTQARIVENEIQLQTTSMFSSYRHNATLTNSKFTKDGWFKTGDLGSLDKDGNLTVSGRTDDIIISGGIKIDPIEIENTLQKYVDGDYIIGGIEHSKWGQALTVIFENDIPRGITIDIIREKLSHDFENTMLPVQLGRIESFLKTDSGKIKRRDTLEKSEITSEHK